MSGPRRRLAGADLYPNGTILEMGGKDAIIDDRRLRSGY